MLDSLKKLAGKQDNKKSPNSSDNPGVFAGVTQHQIKQRLVNESSPNVLSAPKMANEAVQSLAGQKKKESIKMSAHSSLAEDVATCYSEGQTEIAIDMLKSYLNEKKWDADKRLWYMLMDIYQVTGQKNDFEKVALVFSHGFGCSPPSYNDLSGEKKSVMASKNIMTLQNVLKADNSDFREFFKASKEEKYCRINVSQCKFEQSELVALNNLYKLFTDLRKNRVLAVLMGDNNLISFCQSYMNASESNKSLRSDFIQNETLFWLFYLEILQWKGRQEEYENVALDYAMKFEISPPGWENQGVMKPVLVSEENDTAQELQKVLNANNIQGLLDVISEQVINNSEIEIEMEHLERIDFAGAGAITHFIQERYNDFDNDDKKITFKNPNELILTLLEMVGVTEFVNILPRKR